VVKFKSNMEENIRVENITDLLQVEDEKTNKIKAIL
jgi:hypothetical protein